MVKVGQLPARLGSLRLGLRSVSIGNISVRLAQDGWHSVSPTQAASSGMNEVLRLHKARLQQLPCLP